MLVLALWESVEDADEKINLDAWSERTRRFRLWMIVGSGRKRRGRGGIPRDNDDREMNTKVWSVV